MPGAAVWDKEDGAPVARGRAPGDIVRAPGHGRDAGALPLARAAMAPHLNTTYGSEQEHGVAGKRLVLIADYVCPFCYLAQHAAARLHESGRIALDGAPFELRPVGTPLLDAEASWMREAWARTVAPLMEEFGLSVERPKLMTRTRKAHEAAAYARGQDGYAAMHAALYAAYWEEGRDIGRIDVLADIGREAGLDPSGLRVALDIDQFTARVEQDEAWAAQLGLSGVPAYVLIENGADGDGDEVAAEDRGDGTGVAADTRVGLQRYEELESWVMQE